MFGEIIFFNKMPEWNVNILGNGQMVNEQMLVHFIQYYLIWKK
jgi:hypothetical protein